MIVLTAIGFVLVAEGLVLALAPKRLEDLAAYLASLSIDTRRALGLGALAFGVLLLWLTGGTGGG
ncbi:DUF2065 family protein [Fluviibacterium sp. DFM31]|uniref:DUF2065 family protein n=1 Tax=Meridianimarinicoccus marinus TaxID=3231483 RepID=A0ABV3L4K9_9RHOB